MDYPLEVPGFEKEPLWMKKGLGAPKLMQGEDEARRGEGPLDRIVIDDHGRETIATIKGRIGDPFLPAIVVESAEFAPTPPIPIPLLLLGFAPIVLALSGVWGALMGVAAVMMNFPILRSNRPTWQHIVMIIGVFIVAIAATQVLLSVAAGG